MECASGYQRVQQDEAGPARYTETQTVAEISETDNGEVPVLRLRLHKQKNSKKVAWNSNTVDNEHMGKKKSKCCCIYKKPAVFGESSSESEDECENCFGHPEKKKKNCKKDQNSEEHTDCSSEPHKCDSHE